MKNANKFSAYQLNHSPFRWINGKIIRIYKRLLQQLATTKRRIALNASEISEIIT